MLVIYRLSGETRKRLNLGEHLRIALMASCLFVINYWLFYLSTQYLQTGLISVVFSSIVLFNVLNRRIFLKKEVHRRAIVGGLLGIIGVGLIFNESLVHLSLDNGPLYGAFLAIIATYLVSIGNILSEGLSTEGIHVTQATTYGLIYASFGLFILVLLLDKGFNFEFSFSYVASLLYLSIACTSLAFWLYLTLISRAGADKAAFATLIFPVIALLLSTFFEGLTWSIASLSGIPVLILGLWISLYSSSGLSEKRAKSCP